MLFLAWSQFLREEFTALEALVYAVGLEVVFGDAGGAVYGVTAPLVSPDLESLVEGYENVSGLAVHKKSLEVGNAFLVTHQAVSKPLPHVYV